MVAGKVRLAMGLQNPPSNPKPKRTQPKPPLPSPSPSSTIKNSTSSKAVVSRSFGVYFPRSSAQVQPRPPDVAELIRLVEELRERESILKTEVLELKLLKESAAINVPRLEDEIVFKTGELERALNEVEDLRNENGRLKITVAELRKTASFDADSVVKLRNENERLKITVEKMKGNEVAAVKRTASFKAGSGGEFLSSSQRFQGLMEVSVKSNLIKNLKRNNGKCLDAIVKVDDSSSEFRTEEIDEAETPSHSSCNSEELVESKTVVNIRSRVPRVPKPPPRPSLPSSLSSCTEKPIPLSSSPPPTPPVEKVKQVAPPLPPPPPPLKAVAPPPPPPPPKGMRAVAANVRRVPEVVEFYHSIMRRDSKRDAGGCTGPEGLPAATGKSRDMIGEIENRSAYLLAVDERAVLKHFDWPEQKADALREASFGYCDLKKLESEASLFRDDARQPCSPALKKMQALLEKLEHGIYNLSRMRESAMNRYKGFRIPSDWMLETGIVSQIKLASVKLAMKYMRRVSAELEALEGGPEEAELIVQGVRFAFRVHQFAGGFDVETMRAFQDLRDKARSCHVQFQNQHQKLISRSTPC